jgi:hypothetical protein
MLRGRGADVRGGRVRFQWGSREFSVRDLDGDRWYFRQTFA